MDKIREAFRQYFDTPGVELPQPIPERGAVRHAGWDIRYVREQDAHGQPTLEFFGQNRMTNSRHARILASGEVVPLDSYRDALILQDENDTDWGRAAAEQKKHNERVSEQLRKKGLLDE